MTRIFGRRLLLVGSLVGVVVLLLALALGTSGFGALKLFKVLGPSMEPTLPSDSAVLVHRPFIGVGRGDIVLYLELGKYFLKRVVALPGQTVEIRGGRLIVDGNPVEEPYVKEPMRYTTPLVHLATGQYYVLVDNRNNSVDSHVRGPVLEAEIVGVAY